MVADNWSIDFKQLRTDFDKPKFTIKLCQWQPKMLISCT